MPVPMVYAHDLCAAFLAFFCEANPISPSLPFATQQKLCRAEDRNPERGGPSRESSHTVNGALDWISLSSNRGSRFPSRRDAAHRSAGNDSFGVVGPARGDGFVGCAGC